MVRKGKRILAAKAKVEPGKRYSLKEGFGNCGINSRNKI